MKILIIGSGAREHALAVQLGQSPLCDGVYCAPGNAGIANHAQLVAIQPNQIDQLVAFARDNAIDFVMAGSELPLTLGLYDACAAANIACLGPSKMAAQLEGSKIFMKKLAKKYGVPTAQYAQFDNADMAIAHCQNHPTPIVIKADGLAGGKGVVIAQSKEEASDAIKEMMIDKKFGGSGTKIIIEEFLEGEELSYFILADGKNFITLGAAQDHKRINDGDNGPNTGGMGAYSPVPWLNDTLEQTIQTTIVKPFIDGLLADNMPYMGIMFLGLMVHKNQPKLIEINVRFGDPECQTILPRLRGDLLTALLTATAGGLDFFAMPLHERHSLCVVMAGLGYPETPKTGQTIILPNPIDNNVHIYHGATQKDSTGNGYIANGGRVLSVVAQGQNLQQAQQLAYQTIKNINFPDSHYRRDIGWRALGK